MNNYCKDAKKISLIFSQQTQACFFSSSGVFEAAHDFKTEWMVVKGIKGFADETQSSSEKWEKVASLMAASFVAKILSDPDIFQDWPDFNAGIAP